MISVTDEVFMLFVRNGYMVKSISGCFNIIARKGARILLVKVLRCANNITREHAIEMKKTALMLGAATIIVETGDSNLLDNIIYKRFGLHTVSKHTLKNALVGQLMFIKSDRSGLIASLDGQKLRELREQKEFSLHFLAEKIGVSSRMVLKYESNNSEISLQRMNRLVDLFGSGIFQHVNLFDSQTGDIETTNKLQISFKYNNLGFEVRETMKVPFDIIARGNDDIILTTVGDKVDRDIDAVAELLEVDDLAIFEKKKPQDIASIRKDDFMGLETAKDLLKVVREGS